MQIWVIYGILLVNECCGTLGTTVNEAYFALFSMGAHVTGMTPVKKPTKMVQISEAKIAKKSSVLALSN